MLELVRRHPRFGYRRIWALLRREGWRVNRKRVYRLWRQQGLKVPRKQRKKRRLGSSVNGCVRRPAGHKDHVGAWDFLHVRTANGGPLKWFTLVDEYTPECLALEVRRGMTARAVCGVLAEVVRQRGVPAHISVGKAPGWAFRVVSYQACRGYSFLR
jgi:transposase InsO family protein